MNSSVVTSRIAGSGMFVPPRIVANDYFASYLETTDEWIRERTGISERRWVEGTVGVSELAEPAARQAIKNAGLTIEQIGGIVFATVTPDYVFPSSACCLQKRLGIKNAFAFDINAVCSGFVYALATADSLVAKGLAKHVLVVGADIFSKIINPKDRSTCILFGDGAGAVVISSVSAVSESNTVLQGSPNTKLVARLSSGIYAQTLKADGAYGDILCVPDGTAFDHSARAREEGEHLLKMAGKEVFKLAVRHLCEVSEELLKDAGFTPEDVDFFISHQANRRILLSMANHLGVPESKVLMNVEKYGNTSAASVPILLAEAMESGVLKQGHLVLISAFGGGVTWGAILVRI